MTSKKELIQLKNNMDKFLNSLDSNYDFEKFNTERKYAFDVLSNFMSFLFNGINTPEWYALTTKKEMNEQKILELTKSIKDFTTKKVLIEQEIAEYFKEQQSFIPKDE